MNTQTITKKDIEIIKAHKAQFLKPIKTLFELINLGLSDEEILHNRSFRQIANELKEIEEQGHKTQFVIFYNLIMM